ncbi:MAG: sigma-70 family RNA polymerase sigma factor [Planctomycetes bacterium]|nr:sigma-70 family RNA polymerase sigma factor [Planctomycetota bacterium]
MEDAPMRRVVGHDDVAAARGRRSPAPTSAGLWRRAVPVVARWRLPAGLEPDDCVQDMCLRWLAAPPRHLEPDWIAAQRWLGGVLRNVVREWARRRDHLLAAAGHASADPRAVGRRASGPDAEADESFCRQRLRAWLVRRLTPLEADVVVVHRWDGEPFHAACTLHGVRDARAVSSLQRKISRFLSDEAVQRACVLWLHGEDVPRA